MTDFMQGTVVSSRIRLARNLNGYPFPERLKSDKQAKEIIRSVSSAINKVDEFRLFYMDSISDDDALNLVENHLISPALLKKPARSAALINEAGNVSIMINEEDHLREQCIQSGLSLRSSYAIMSAKDSLIARSIAFAYDEQLGYLTACPTNLGTGLRASVMMFLPALAIGGLMPELVSRARRNGLTIRGAYGEGSSAEGYTYQLSNEVTLGVSEEEILTQVEEAVSKVEELEAVERKNLRNGANGLALKDKCLRAYGILTNCALMPSEEFSSLCADLKLAACLGYLNCDTTRIDELTIKMKPYNLNVLAGRKLTSEERDSYRAQYASNRIKSIVSKC